MKQFELVTEWQIDAPIERVWAALRAVEEWPRWWPYVRSVRSVTEGDADGVGAVHVYHWGSRLPYSISLSVRVERCEKPFLLDGRASGDLQGTGTWRLSSAGNGTRVRYEWNVDLNQAWMRWLAPVLAPAFRWNHHAVMAAGGAGLQRWLAR
jgi:uncharacterized protein YndB with AHSA1/START domain